MTDRRQASAAWFRIAFQFLCWEACFAMAYETWIGPIYLNGLAGELGVDVRMVAFLTALPWIGLAGQFAGLWAMDRVPSVKGYTLTVASAARTTWSIPMFFALYWGWSRAGVFPVQRWFTVLALSAGCAAVFSSSSAVAWMSWMRGLVPSTFQGRFFGTRQRYVMGALILANLLAGTLVGWKHDGLYIGYLVLGGVALLAALTSTLLLSRVPDLAKVPTVRQAGTSGFWQALRDPLRDARFRRVLISGAAFNGAIQLAGPYFPYYFTHNLHIPMGRVAFWAIFTNLGALLSSAYWGRRIDRGDPVRTMVSMGALIVISPLFYLTHSADWVSHIAPFEYFVNGIAWSGYILSLTTLQFRACPPGKNAAYFSMVSVGSGLSGAFATFIGGYLAKWLEPWGGFLILWGLASAARFAALALVVWPLLGTPAKKMAVALEV